MFERVCVKIIDWMEKTKSMSFDISEKLRALAATHSDAKTIALECLKDVLYDPKAPKERVEKVIRELETPSETY